MRTHSTHSHAVAGKSHLPPAGDLRRRVGWTLTPRCNMPPGTNRLRLVCGGGLIGGSLFSPSFYCVRLAGGAAGRGGGWWRPLCRPIGIENRDVLGNLEGKGPNEMRPCSSAIWGGASGPRHSLLILREGGEERRRVKRSQNSIETSQCAWSGVLHGYPFFSAAYPAADAAYPATLTSHDPFR